MLILRKLTAVVGSLVALGATLSLGLVLGHAGCGHAGLSSAHASDGQGTLLKPGPWGTLDYVPMTIAAPPEILPVRALEAQRTHWFFGGFTPDNLAKLLDAVGVPTNIRDQLLAPSSLQILPNGLDVTPPRDVVLSLSPAARLEVYKCLAHFPENRSQLVFTPAASLKNRFHENNVSDETVSLFDNLSCSYGRYRILSGLPCLLAELPNYEEKARFVRSLASQKTLLLRLHVGPDSDINALFAYWGKGCWSTDVRAMLESLARIPGGICVDIVEVLPPRAVSLLYTFPLPDNPMNGQPVQRDCNWTSFNFFLDPPDPNYSNPDYIREKLSLNYYPVVNDPRYGDLVLFYTPQGTLVHSAVFLADDIVYTKNGNTPLHPWLLSSISDLLEQYSFMVPSDQKLTVSYFRSKYY